MVKKRLLSIITVLSIFISLFTSIFFVSPIIMIGKADPGDISNTWDNSTTLNVTVVEIIPRINWYDFQYNNSGTWESKLNQQIDVNNSAEYRFIIDISSDQGWDDIDYVNITAWYDQDDESSTYNQTEGGNLNLNLQYENTTGTAVWRLAWPTGGEVTEGTYSDEVGYDPYGSPAYTECHNLSFSFIPNYQFRYAPGDGAWESGPGYNDTMSWNFNITVTDSGESAVQPYTISKNDEFGVYSYSEIASAGWPTITGNPGENATADNPITLVTRSNGNYSVSVDVDNLTHVSFPGATISRDNVWVSGGDLITANNFTSEGGVLYIYGSDVTYHIYEANGTSLSTSDIEYTCDIPLGQIAGDYTAQISYHLTTTQ
jgi:hypothetical protein